MTHSFATSLDALGEWRGALTERVDTLARFLAEHDLAQGAAGEQISSLRERLGKTMDIRIAPAYHRLRLKELALTADYMEKLAEEKAREREEKERLREERKVEQEIEREPMIPATT